VFLTTAVFAGVLHLQTQLSKMLFVKNTVKNANSGE
jgi:hypothetical protein